MFKRFGAVLPGQIVVGDVCPTHCVFRVAMLIFVKVRQGWEVLSVVGWARVHSI